MPAKNIECQLAQGQIGRYLAGAQMSEEAVAQLEGHIAECEDCSSFIETKRNSLRELAANRKAVVYLPEEPAREEAAEAAPAPAPRNPAAKALIDAIREKSAAARETAPVLETKREVGTPRATHWKALVYSTGLGLVLYGMTFITSNPTALFGERATEETPLADPKAETPANSAPIASASKEDGDPFTEDAPVERLTTDAITNSTPTKNETAPIVAATGTDRAGTPSVSPNAAPAKAETTISKSSTPTPPRVNVRSQPVRRTSRPVRRTAAAGDRRPNTIRVYDESGRPIKGE